MNASHRQNTAQAPLFYVRKDDQQFGPWTWEEIAAGLHSGDLSGAEYLWCEGLKDWQTISSFQRAQQNEPGLVEEFKNASPLHVMFKAVLWVLMLALLAFMLLQRSVIDGWFNAAFDRFPWLAPVILVVIGLSIWAGRKPKE